MSYFRYKNNELFGEEVPLQEIVKAFGTPCYVYSKEAIMLALKAFEVALQNYPHQIHYAVKANSNLAILNILAQQDMGFDIVSEGELERVLKAGGKPEKIVFSGVGKSKQELKKALSIGVGCINIESFAELMRLQEIARTLNIKANIALRVNPDVATDSHPYISTGLKENKFGVHINEAFDFYLTAQKLSHIHVKGIAFHIGSQITSLDPFVAAINKVLVLVDELEKNNIVLKHINVGGGLGVQYEQEKPPSPESYVKTIIQQLGKRKLDLHLEPGRSIVAQAGVLLTQVEYLKNNFAIVDASMNDLMRPALYESFHEIVPLKIHAGGQEMAYDIVGPVCETGDFLGKSRKLNLQEGDLLAVLSTGAYGFSMSSNYNSRPRAAEVMIDVNNFQLIRPREQLNTLFNSEILLDKTR